MDEITITVKVDKLQRIFVPKKYLEAINAGPEDWVELKIHKKE